VFKQPLSLMSIVTHIKPFLSQSGASAACITLAARGNALKLYQLRGFFYEVMQRTPRKHRSRGLPFPIGNFILLLSTLIVVSVVPFFLY
jgi:hypothetical protein